MKLSEIEWTGSEEDLTATVGDYTLRVRLQAYRGFWYYETAFKGKMIEDDLTSSCKTAQRVAFFAMENHKNDTI